jgi:hypothetical protein
VTSVAGRYDRVFAARPELQALVAAFLVHREVPVPPPASASTPVAHRSPPTDYHELVRRVSRIVSGLVEPDASVLVVSRGDPNLLELSTGHAAHFPQSPDGGFAGFYPRDDEGAVAHLSELRDAGAGYLVFPATSMWWLDHYRVLASYLLTSARAVHHGSDCLVFDLSPERSTPPS